MDWSSIFGLTLLVQTTSVEIPIHGGWDATKTIEQMYEKPCDKRRGLESKRFVSMRTVADGIAEIETWCEYRSVEETSSP